MSKGEGRTIGYSVQYKRADGVPDDTGGKYLARVQHWTDTKCLTGHADAQGVADAWNTRQWVPGSGRAVVVRHFVRPRAEKKEWGVWCTPSATNKIGHSQWHARFGYGTRAQADAFVADSDGRDNHYWGYAVTPRPA